MWLSEFRDVLARGLRRLQNHETACQVIMSLDRREFLRASALAVAGVPLLKSGLGTVPQEKKLGFALVGLGSLSTNQIAPALMKTKNCRLAGIVTGTPAKAAAWKAKYNIPDTSIYNYDTIESIARNADVDVVYVVTPNALHARDVIKAAKAGKHVLCEKPMEVSTAQCEAMIAACRKAGKQLAIGYRCQFDPTHLECFRLAREKVLGDVRLIDAAFGFPAGDPGQWRLNAALSGGGPMMDVGIYALQSACLLTGESPVSVSATTTKTDPVKFRSVEETMTFDLKFPGGVIAHCSTSYKVPGLNRFTVHADRGTFGMEPAYNYGGNRAWRSDNVPFTTPPVDQFAMEMDDFANCIINGKPTRVPGEQGLRDVKIMMAAYESARVGRVISLV
ncbi:MAG: oxidoreductase domain protein [Gemmatimonadetes bacterium]|nr:oxidoreductase domain protein [Gemmatimonadota bacterium]